MLKVGDIVVGKPNNGYWFTCEGAVCSVTEADIYSKIAHVKVLSSPNGGIGNVYVVDSDKFFLLSKSTVKNPWIEKNWAFLSSRAMIKVPITKIEKLFSDLDAPLTGRFFGTVGLLTAFDRYKGETRKGTHTLFLHPFIETSFEDTNILGIYVDPRKYITDDNGVITGLKGLYEPPIYAIVLRTE